MKVICPYCLEIFDSETEERIQGCPGCSTTFEFEDFNYEENKDTTEVKSEPAEDI